MAKRLAELGALQDAVSNNEAAPSRLGLAGYIRGLFLDWSANPYNPLSRLTARGRLLGYFWDSGAIGLSMNFADQNYLVKDGTVQSKSFNQIVNFTRTTNATVTNSAGVITYAPHNLLTFSEQFDNAAWSKTTTTVTANAIASPTSTTTGDTLTAGGANSTTLHSYTAIAQPYTFSIYIRRRTGTGAIEITADGSTYVAKTITSDWTRFDTTITPTAGTRTPGVRIVTSGDAIDVWGAQLEVGTSPAAYNSTTVKNLLGYSELFDNAAWTKSNSFVQTNLLTYSEAFDNAAWSKASGTSTNPVVTANAVLAPNGYQTADTVAFGAIDAAGDFSVISQVLTLATTQDYTRSIYVKATTAGDVGKLLYFYVTDGVLKDVVTVTLTADWQRVTKTLSMASGPAKSFTIGTLGSTNGGANQAAVSADLWGFQVVQGSDAGDYRRTDAAALPVFYPNHNGVVCAEKLVSDTVNQLHYLRQDFAGNNDTLYTASIDVKAAEWNSVQIEFISQGSGIRGIVVNLTTGAITVGRTGIFPTSYGATALSNGWYRVWITNSNETGETLERVNIFATNNGAAGAIAGDGTSGIYIFGAQLSDSASLDPYVLNAAAAPTAAAYYGARFDYDPVTLAPKGLLIEEQRSNSLLQSEDFSSASWAKQNSSITSNTVLAPDGNTTADTLTADGTSTTHWMYQTNATSATGKTISIYAKAGTNNFIQILFGGDITPWANFNLATGEVGSIGTNVTASIKDAKNGWYRIIVATTSTTANNPYFSIIENATSSRGGANSLTTTVHLWGAQSEIGAFATSYIPTAASQVTRAADVATIQGSNFYSWINQNAGSLYAQFSTPANGNRNIIALDDNTANNNIRLRTEGTDPYLKQAWVGTEQVALDLGTVAANTVYKIAASYQINDYAGVIANGTVGTDVAAITPIMTMMRLGTDQAGAYLNSTIKTFTYYPQKLSTDILKGLTA
jgi:hypothetical protein